MKAHPGEVGLADAAAKLRMPYQDCHRLVLTGVLEGTKRGSRWFVRSADVERLVRSRASAKSSTAA